MAEELDVTLEETPPEIDDGPGEEPGGRKLYIIIPAILLILAAQTVAAYYTISMIFFSDMQAIPQGIASTTEADSSSMETEEVASEPYETTGEIYEFADIIVNPSGTLGRRYLVVSMSFEVSHKKVLVELASKEPILRDALLTLLAQKSLDYVADISNMEAIREEIMATANAYLNDGRIIRIFFTGYILQ